MGIEGTSAFYFNNELIIGRLFELIFLIGLALKLSEKGRPLILVIGSIFLIGVGIFPATIYKIH